MRFDVRPILHTPGKRLTFQFSLDLSDVEFAGRHPISRPVEVEGAVSNTADLLELELTARTTLDAVCDRCGKAFLQDKAVPFRCLLAEELQNEDNDEIVEYYITEQNGTIFVVALGYFVGAEEGYGARLHAMLDTMTF